MKIITFWVMTNTAWKVSKYGVFSGPYFPAFELNTHQKKIPYLDTFYAVKLFTSELGLEVFSRPLITSRKHPCIKRSSNIITNVFHDFPKTDP